MDLKEPVESGKSRNSPWTGTTTRGSATWTVGLALRNLVLPRADVVHLSEKGTHVFSHSLTKPGKRALNQQCWGWGTSIYPTHTCLMSMPAKGSPEPEEGSQVSQRAPEGHHKAIPATSAIKLASCWAQLKCLQSNAGSIGNKQKEVTVILLAPCRCGGIALMTGAPEWKDTGS